MEYSLQPRRNLLKALLSSIIIALALVSMGMNSEAVVLSVVLFIVVFLSCMFIDMFGVLLEYRKQRII